MTEQWTEARVGAARLEPLISRDHSQHFLCEVSSSKALVVMVVSLHVCLDNKEEIYT